MEKIYLKTSEFLIFQNQYAFDTRAITMVVVSKGSILFEKFDNNEDFLTALNIAAGDCVSSTKEEFENTYKKEVEILNNII